jgi:hypothetical protein
VLARLWDATFVRKFREHSVKIQRTFSENPRNIQ